MADKPKEDPVTKEQWARVTELRKQERSLEAGRDLKKAELSEVNTQLKRVQAQLRGFIDNEQEPNLFSAVEAAKPAPPAEPEKGGKKKGKKAAAEKPAEPATAAPAEPAKGRKKKAAPAGDWKAVEVSKLGGIRPKDVEVLEAAGVKTAGDLAEATRSKKLAEAVPALGEAGTKRTEAAMQKLLAEANAADLAETK